MDRGADHDPAGAAGINTATKGTPAILALDEAETIGKRFPGFESIDVPAGAFRARPATPSDTVTMLAVTYRFDASELMPNIVAAAIARSILTTKAKLVAITPLANQIEAPDPDDKSPILPVHPGVAAYLSNGDQSVFDQFQQYFYVGGLVVSLAGLFFAAASARWNRRRSEADWRPIKRLVEIADAAPHADVVGLAALEGEFHQLVSAVLGRSPRGRRHRPDVGLRPWRMRGTLLTSDVRPSGRRRDPGLRQRSRSLIEGGPSDHRRTCSGRGWAKVSFRPQLASNERSSWAGRSASAP